MRLVLLFLCTTLAACGGNVFTVDDLVRLPLEGGDADPTPGDDASSAPDSRVGAAWDAGDHEAAPDVGLEGGGNLPGDAGSDSESTTDSDSVASDSGGDVGDGSCISLVAGGVIDVRHPYGDGSATSGIEAVNYCNGTCATCDDCNVNAVCGSFAGQFVSCQVSDGKMSVQCK